MSRAPTALGVSPAPSIMFPLPHGSGCQALAPGKVCADATPASASEDTTAASAATTVIHILGSHLCFKFHPSVFGASGARAVGGQGMGLAVAGDAQPRRRHPALDERVANRLGALF